MNIIVCVKQVPDTAQIRLNPETRTLIRDGVENILNPYDAEALETALILKDKFGAKVTVVTMGPPQAKDILKDAIALGADEAFLLTDRVVAGLRPGSSGWLHGAGWSGDGGASGDPAGYVGIES